MFRKYPRTHHIEGSQPQPGDEDLQFVPMTHLQNRYLVIEEKVDGANTGISFDSDGMMLLQSRGHYLTGGSREKQFDLFKQWASSHRQCLWSLLSDRFVLYGEWMYAKHTVFYDDLPHYFLEFDVLDKTNGRFLSTELRRKLIADTPVTSVPVLDEGFISVIDLKSLVKRSLFKSTNWCDNLAESARDRGLDPERILKETDPSDEMEGLYIKVEKENTVEERYKYIRSSFNASDESGDHWQSRPILPNQLRKDVDIFI